MSCCSALLNWPFQTSMMALALDTVARQGLHRGGHPGTDRLAERDEGLANGRPAQREELEHVDDAVEDLA